MRTVGRDGGTGEMVDPETTKRRRVRGRVVADRRQSSYGARSPRLSMVGRPLEVGPRPRPVATSRPGAGVDTTAGRRARTWRVVSLSVQALDLTLELGRLVYFNAGSWQMSSRVLPSGSWKNSALALMVSKTVGRGFKPRSSSRRRSAS